MKRFLSIMAILCALCSTNAIAQTNNDCNPAFTSQTLPAGKMKFTPTVPAATGVQHSWTFGDGTGLQYAYEPIHQYMSNGVYTVKHFVTRFNPNQQVVCMDSAFQTVTVNNFCNFDPIIYHYAANELNPAQVTFYTNVAVNMPPDSIRWTFGDGTSSFDQNPVHTYSAPGQYTVCVRIKKFTTASAPPCIIERCTTVTVLPQQTTCATLNPTFTTGATTSPLTVQFTNTTTGLQPGDSILWFFGDGTMQYGGNPMHTYPAAGNYTACLKIKRPAPTTNTAMCVKQTCSTVTVGTLACALTASFTSVRVTTAPAYTYQFTNTSAGSANTDLYLWTFGDGSSSTLQNPLHQYTQPGTYNVCLRVQKVNPNGIPTNCVREICQQIVITPMCNVQATWTKQPDPANPRKIYFTNTSSPMPANYSILWTFGDGTSATSFNAVHEYAQPGTYFVCLRITYGNCVATRCDSINVTGPQITCTQLSQFNFTGVSSNNLTKNFSPVYPQNNVQYTWTFGDGTGAQTPTATHTYPAPGNYTACLTAFKNVNCATTTCRTVAVTSVNTCSTITLGFNSYPDSVLPNRVRFSAFSNQPMLTQTWTITRIPTTPGTGTATLTGANPTYVFADTGWYRVCVRATFANNCVREFCREIRINHVGPVLTTCTSPAYPNPATSVVNMNLNLTQTLMMHGSVYSNNNVLVAQHSMPGVPGNNVYSINVGNLPAGNYYLKVWYGNQFCASPFVKL